MASIATIIDHEIQYSRRNLSWSRNLNLLHHSCVMFLPWTLSNNYRLESIHRASLSIAWRRLFMSHNFTTTDSAPQSQSACRSIHNRQWWKQLIKELDLSACKIAMTYNLITIRFTVTAMVLVIWKFAAPQMQFVPFINMYHSKKNLVAQPLIMKCKLCLTTEEYLFASKW